MWSFGHDVLLCWSFVVSILSMKFTSALLHDTCLLCIGWQVVYIYSWLNMLELVSPVHCIGNKQRCHQVVTQN